MIAAQDSRTLHRRLFRLAGRVPVAMVAACPFPAQRGTPIRIRQMGEALVRLGFDVHVVTYDLGINEPDPPGMTVHRTRPVVRYRDLGAGPTYGKLFVLDPLLLKKLVSVLRQYGIRIVHAHHFEGAICALLARRFAGGVTVVYDAHTSLRDELLDYAFVMPRILKKAAAHILDSTIPRWSDHVVTVSHRLRDFVIEQGVPEPKVTVIPMGVNLGDFPMKSREEARRRLGLPEAPTVLYTGNLAPFQGVHRLLQSMVHVVKKAPSSRLVIVGRPVANYQRRANELGIAHQVVFAGERPFEEVREFLAAADVVVLPRDNCVGFPLKLLNYMAAGKAIVAFKGGSSDVLSHLQNGYVVEDRNELAFADGILRFLQDESLSDRMGAAARQTADRYDTESLVASVGDLYHRILLAGPAPASNGHPRSWGDLRPGPLGADVALPPTP